MRSKSLMPCSRVVTTWLSCSERGFVHSLSRYVPSASSYISARSSSSQTRLYCFFSYATFKFKEISNASSTSFAIAKAARLDCATAKAGRSRKRSSKNRSPSSFVFLRLFSADESAESGIVRTARCSRPFENGSSRIVAVILNTLWTSAIPAPFAECSRNSNSKTA